MQENWLAVAWVFPRRVISGAVAQVRKRFTQLKNRYGLGYAKAMLVVVCLAFFSPIPGTTLAGIVLVVVIAEIHRTISSGGRSHEAIVTEEVFMSITCDVILQENATPEQLTTLGSALWRWCGRAGNDTGIYRHLDNQVLADLIAGKQPMSGQTPRQFEERLDGVHFEVRDQGSHDRQATMDRLRRELPADAVRDILIDGTSWKVIKPREKT